MFSTQRGWEEALDALIAETRPILETTSAETERHLPKIPNIVTTVSLLKPHSTHRLPLSDIARSCPNAQFDPRLFAAVRITLRDNTSQAAEICRSALRSVPRSHRLADRDWASRRNGEPASVCSW